MNIYEQVTARIMEILETGSIPWKKPWISSEGPKNLISKKPYRGINSFLLNCSPYNSPYWMTYRNLKSGDTLLNSPYQVSLLKVTTVRLKNSKML